MMGSHLDSQPRGGRIDGTLGVMAAVEIAELLMEARRGGQGFERDFCVVNWTNEEGARFRPSLMGSGVFAGHGTQAQALAACDDQGVSLADALSGIGYRGTDTPPPIPAIYLELHAEQAARLERHGVQIGLVTRNWGAVRLDLVFEGEQAHTGPTPMSDRRDALLAAARAVVALRALADSGPEGLHSSVGRLLVSPNSSNVVPDRVVLTAEVRAADDGVLGAAEEAMLRLIRDAAASANVEVGFASRSSRLGRSLPAGPVDFLEDCARAIGLAVMRLDTVAGHDALSFIGCCPTALVFVPSMNGLAHNEAERTRPEDMDAGTALMLEAAFRLCRGDEAAATPDMADPGSREQRAGDALAPALAAMKRDPQADAGDGSRSSRDRPHA
jgi:N-carbamoyl-L-amino-acid hydrolase